MNVKFKYVLKYYPIFQLQTEKNPITSINYFGIPEAQSI